MISSKESKAKKKVDNSKKVKFAASECKYSVITNVAKQIGWKLVNDDKKDASTNVFWIDIASIHERFRTIQPWQMINHFPGMPNIARKNRMGHHLNKMLKLFPKEYAFYPRTWVLPGEMHDFRSQFDNNGNSIGNKIYIIKPDAGCQGRGIFLTRTLDKVPTDENVVAQLYIQKPLLIDGYKFDLRLYCVVTSVKPLRMYLMQDGLVRMCTEEYVKPTQKNLDNVCMHLTNYAVNKHNENFQQSSAQTSEECQDEGSKRSLLWFMNFVRETRGDQKADWLWKRMGQLCVQTVLSILPTLSREYDQHFKSFNNVPSKPVADIFAAKQRQNRPMQKDKNDDDDEEEDDDEDDDDDEDEDSKDEGADSKTDNNDDKATDGGGDAGGGLGLGLGGGSEKGGKSKKPLYRGSRCFEILGFDIMMDSSLKPWLIEVNHLPSFGTDSPLDLDIKNRLMQQVLSCIPVKADDEVAYMMHHKAEAEKRLTKDNKRNRVDRIDERPQREQPVTTVKPKRTVEPLSRKEPVSDSNSNSNSNSEKSDPGTDEALTASDASNSNSNSNNPDHLPVIAYETSDGNQSSLVSGTGSGVDCTYDRLEEIKQILSSIYQECRPDKVSKVDRLLERYVGREEQFLSFVYEKYGITPPPPNPRKDRDMLTNPNPNPNPKANTNTNTTAVVPLAPKPPTEIKERPAINKRISRSLSPPPTQKRPVASWKGISDEDAAALRAEAVDLHVPKEGDVWIERERRALTQFTQIFPLEHHHHHHHNSKEKGSNGSDGNGNGDGDGDEEKEDFVDGEDQGDDVDGGNGNDDRDGNRAVVKKGDVAKGKTPRASYEDIIFQVFLEDRRQMMRFRNPLVARTHDRPSSEPRGKDGHTLPPLDNKNSSRMGGGGFGFGKAPPRNDLDRDRSGLDKVPTKVQMEAVNRLYQGLSSRSTNKDAAQLGGSSYANSYTNSSGNRDGMMLQGGSSIIDSSSSSSSSSSSVIQYTNMSISPKQQSSYLLHYGNDDESAYAGAGLVFQTKTARMMEQSRRLRMQLEVQRAPPESVLLRQQVFAFNDQQGHPHPMTRNANTNTNTNGINLNLENPLFSASSFVSSEGGLGLGLGLGGGGSNNHHHHHHHHNSHDLQYFNVARASNKVRSKFF